ncbi:MAG: ABC transporter ATP-binding protein [Planctomycetes bacterium]|nr:ABC transporter ATP-binding protein [Planctomycetota bacterium]
MIEVKSITKSYEDITPLQDANFCIDGGDFVSVIGPSGSGKTTLLNVMAGLLTPTEGQVVVDEVSLYELNQRNRVAFRRRNFGFIFQSFNLISYFTAVENVEVPLYLAGEKKKRQRYVAQELLARVGLEDKGDRFPSQLSIGEQQRVVIARTLANSPRIIFADEPTGNLDGKAGKVIMNYMKELNELGVTILLVTHDLEMANFAKRKIELADGRLLL